MLINGGAINDVAINDYSFGEFNLETITESIVFDSSASVGLLGVVAEIIVIGATHASQLIANNHIEESLSLLDKIRVVMHETLISGMSLSDNNEPLVRKISAVIEALSLSYELSESFVACNVMNDGINIDDSTGFFFMAIVQEVIQIIDIAQEKATMMQLVIDGLLIDCDESAYTSLIETIREKFKLDDAVTTNSIFQEIVEELIKLSVGLEKDLEYISYLLSPESLSVSTYSNFNFSGSCVFNDEVLLINKSGMYKKGGSTDDGNDIYASIQTAALSFGTSHLKRCLNVYLGIYNTGHLVLKASVDGGVSAYYEVTRATENLQTQRITLGKGLKGRYWQFQLITQDNADFELESIDFLPISLSRRI